MRSRRTTSCRSSGIGRRIAFGAGALALAGLAAPAAGQGFVPYPPLGWVAEESLDSNQFADDAGVDIVYWYDSGEDEHWIYVTGWVTEMDGHVELGTRFATYKYDASLPASPAPAQEAYFPPLTTSLQSGDTYKAVKMTVDPASGDIYIAGEGPAEPGGSDQDYVVVKYDKDLSHGWTSGDGARYYDGDAGGDDIPADIAVDSGNQAVVVTGTSPGNGTGSDIATVALRAATGFRQTDSWPDVGWGDGVRRYNNAVDGDDQAVALALTVFGDENDASFLSVLVTGFSEEASNFDYTTHLWAGSAGTIKWNRPYDGGGDDIATGMVFDGAHIYVTGYSWGGFSSGLDYLTVAYQFGFLPPITTLWTERFDYDGEFDYSADIGVHVPPTGPREIWVTGKGWDATGAAADAVTVRYQEQSGSVTDAWADGRPFGSESEPLEMTLFDSHPYITGRRLSGVIFPMLAWMYHNGSPDPARGWDSSYTPDGDIAEGRAIVVAEVDGLNRSVYITGRTRVDGEGWQFATWRYEE